MTRVREYSDHENTDNAEQAVPLKAHLRIRPFVDAQGYACFLTCKYQGKVVKTIPFEIAGPAKDGEPDMVTAAAQWRFTYPLDPADIVMPEGWALNPDGSAIREVQG